MLTTTLNELLKFNPCRTGWDKLTGQGTDKSKWTGSDDPLGFDEILESNGLDDAIWACRVLKGEDLKRFKLWVCDIAERSLAHIPEGEERPAHALKMARAYINGECSNKKLHAACVAAHAVYATCGTHAARAAYTTAHAIYTAAYARDAYVADAACAAADKYTATRAAYDTEKAMQTEMFVAFINS